MKSVLFFCCLIFLMSACDSPSNTKEENENKDSSAIEINSPVTDNNDDVTSTPDTKADKSIDILRIDKIERECLKTEEGMTTQGSIICVNEAEQMWDAGLNKYYKVLTKDASAVEKKAYLKAQRSWLKYRDAQFAFLGSFYNEQAGTIFQQFYSADRNELVKIRTLELIRYGFSMEGPDDEALSNYITAFLKMEEDPTFIACQEKDDYTNLAMRMCANEAAERFQAKIKTNITALEKIISKETKAKLKKTQAVWTQFVKDETAIYDAIQENAGGGTMYPTMAAGRYLTLAQRQNKVLMDLLESVKN